MKTMLVVPVCLAMLSGGPTPGAAQDRWQIQLNSGTYLYDLQLVKLERASLIVRQADTTVTVPVREITQLVFVQGTAQRAGARAGARDVVYQLALLDLDERLAILREILEQHPPAVP